jgi:hypothetical protein
MAELRGHYWGAPTAVQMVGLSAVHLAASMVSRTAVESVEWWDKQSVAQSGDWKAALLDLKLAVSSDQHSAVRLALYLVATTVDLRAVQMADTSAASSAPR